MVELKAGGLRGRTEIPAVRHQGGMAGTPLLSRKAVEQTRQAPGKLRKKVAQPTKIVKRYEGNRGNGFIRRWVYQEVGLSMSKMSIVSLVLGLLFLGTLFFIIGFLAAVATLKSDEGRHSSPSAWQASNAPHQSAHGGGKLGLAAGSLVGQAIGKQLAPLGKVVGAASSVVPRPLQPFARYGAGAAHVEARSVGRQMNPFDPHRRMVAPEQEYYGGVPPQHYATPQGQPYGVPAMPAGYQPQQLAAFPQGEQGGYGQGYAPQQQPMMMQQQTQHPMYQQQPTYQQHPMYQQQPMAPQQVAPQPQQMMMPPPYYPPQMAPQQGYYR